MIENNKPKKIKFYEDLIDIDIGSHKVLFRSDKWYDVVFNCSDNVTFYVIAENGEKIGFREDENDNLFCIRR